MRTGYPSTILPRAAAVFFMAITSTVLASGEGEPELAKYMGSLQYFSHKLQLSLDHENLPLARFYTHEMEEAIEEVAEVKSYDGFPIGQLTDAMLKPVFSRLETVVKDGDMAGAQQQLDDVISSCNQCHTATEHGFIVIQKNSDNPYMQSFSPDE